MNLVTPQSFLHFFIADTIQIGLTANRIEPINKNGFDERF